MAFIACLCCMGWGGQLAGEMVKGNGFLFGRVVECGQDSGRLQLLHVVPGNYSRHSMLQPGYE